MGNDLWSPEGMCVCIAAPSLQDFEELLNDDPYLRKNDGGGGGSQQQQPVFDHVEKFRWTQVVQ